VAKQMKNQTALEWLMDQLDKKDVIHPLILWKAKEMEKQQISEAYRTGVEEDVYNNPLRTGEMYYNDTFAGE
jgi:hypothetical protein